MCAKGEIYRFFYTPHQNFDAKCSTQIIFCSLAYNFNLLVQNLIKIMTASTTLTKIIYVTHSMAKLMNFDDRLAKTMEALP